jgi:hypothetical protein
METSELIRLYPEIYHMAEDGSWPSIEHHGLLSSRALVDRWGITAPSRDRLISDIRDESTVIEHPDFGTAVVRDQKPMNAAVMADALVDMSVSEWVEHLNARVFFFLQRQRLSGLLNARSYRGRVHTVITLDTASLIRVHEHQIELSPINSGFAQPHSKASRGRDTIAPIARYAHRKRDAPRTQEPWDVAELCVYGGVADIADHVVRVERMLGDEVVERLR